MARVADDTADAGTAGLVNNAGIAGTGPIECAPPDKLRHLFDVAVAQVAMIQAFLLLLRADHVVALEMGVLRLIPARIAARTYLQICVSWPTGSAPLPAAPIRQLALSTWRHRCRDAHPS